MASDRARRRAPPFVDPPGYARHRPEATLLYELVERHYPQLVTAREAAGRPLPKYVQGDFAAFLKCGRLECGFLRTRCEDCHAEKRIAFSYKGFAGAGATAAGKRIISIAKSDKIMTMKIVALIGILVLFQQASWGATRANDGKLSSRSNALIEPFLGDFLGSLNTAETPSPYDDLNHNPCGGPDDPLCRDEHNNPTPHLSPLANVIFRISRNGDGKIQASIFQTTEQYRSNTPIDLIGQYCDSSIGDLAEYDFTSTGGRVTVANLSFPIHPGKCSDRLGYSVGSNF